MSCLMREQLFSVLSKITYIYQQFEPLEAKGIKKDFLSLLSCNFTLIITAGRGCGNNKTLAKGHKVKCVRREFVLVGSSHLFFRVEPLQCESRLRTFFITAVSWWAAGESPSVHAASHHIEVTLVTQPSFPRRSRPRLLQLMENAALCLCF